MFGNNPQFKNAEGENQIRRYSHQPMSIEHNGIHAKIAANGKVTISKVARVVENTDEVEWDEVEIPASLVFKLASLLKATRKVEYLTAVPASSVIPEGK